MYYQPHHYPILCNTSHMQIHFACVFSRQVLPLGAEPVSPAVTYAIIDMVHPPLCALYASHGLLQRYMGPPTELILLIPDPYASTYSSICVSYLTLSTWMRPDGEVDASPIVSLTITFVPVCRCTHSPYLRAARHHSSWHQPVCIRQSCRVWRLFPSVPI